MSEIFNGAEGTGADPGGQPAGDNGGAGTPPPGSGGSAPGSEGQGAPGAPPSEGGSSWIDSLSPEYRDDVSLKGYKSPNDLAKAYLHAQKLIGANKVAIPGEKATEDDWAQVFTKLGRPSDASAYDIKPLEGAKPESLEEFKQTAHKAGLLPRQADAVYRYYADQVTKARASQKEAYEKLVNSHKTDLQKEWPDSEYQTGLREAFRGMNDFFGKDFAEWANKSGVGNDKQFIKAMRQVYQAMGEDRLKGDGGTSFGESKDSLQQKINAMYERGSPYLDTNHPGHAEAQKEMQNLMNMLHRKS